APIVPATKVVFEPHVQHDEEVTASHFIQPQLGFAVSAVGPGDRYDRIVEASHYRLQGKLDSKVEMVGEQRLNLIDDVPPIRLTRVGGVVVAVLKEDADPRIDDPIDDQLHPWVIDRAAALSESSAES